MNSIETAVVNLANKNGDEKDIAVLKNFLDSQLSYEELGALIYILQELASRSPKSQIVLIRIIFKLKILMGILEK